MYVILYFKFKYVTYLWVNEADVAINTIWIYVFKIYKMVKIVNNVLKLSGKCSVDFNN